MGTKHADAPKWSSDGGSTSVGIEGQWVTVKMTAANGIWHEARYTPEQARDLIIALGAILDEVQAP